MKAGWWDAPIALQDLTEAICIKRQIALQIKLDSTFRNKIQLDWIISINQAFNNSLSPI